MLTRDELIIGPAYVSIDGVDFGLLGSDGLTYNLEFETVEFESSQTQLIPALHRNRVRGTITATFHQLTLEKWRILEDIEDAPVGNTLVGKWNSCGPTPRILTLTLPGPNCGIRTMQCTAVIMTPGEKVFSNGEYTGAPVEFLLLGDPATNILWTLIETPASVTVPAVQTYQHINGAGTETAFVSGGTIPAASVSVQASFNVAIRPDQFTAGKFMLIETTSGDPVACTYAAGNTAGNTDFTKVVVTPTGGFDASTDYTLVVAPGVQSTSGKSGLGNNVVFSTGA